METLILYSNGCPKCKVIKSKLEAKNIKFSESSNIEELTSLGIQSLPILKVGDEFLNFVDANTWVNNQTSDSHSKEEI